MGDPERLLHGELVGRSNSEKLSSLRSVRLGFSYAMHFVEDSKFLRMSTERALTTAGYEVILASDGEQVSNLAREHAPALILLDVMLPKISGPDVLKLLKNDPATSAIPVMMLTSLSQKNAAQMKKDGASSFFEKSDSMLGKGPDSLVASVNRMLRKQEPGQ